MFQAQILDRVKFKISACFKVCPSKFYLLFTWIFPPRCFRISQIVPFRSLKRKESDRKKKAITKFNAAILSLTFLLFCAETLNDHK